MGKCYHGLITGISDVWTELFLASRAVGFQMPLPSQLSSGLQTLTPPPPPPPISEGWPALSIGMPVRTSRGDMVASPQINAKEPPPPPPHACLLGENAPGAHTYACTCRGAEQGYTGCSIERRPGLKIARLPVIVLYIWQSQDGTINPPQHLLDICRKTTWATQGHTSSLQSSLNDRILWESGSPVLGMITETAL